MSINYVTTNASTGSGSFAAAVAAANDGDSIFFSEDVFSRGNFIEIALAQTLSVDKNLTLNGGPFRVRLTTTSAFRVVEIASGKSVVFTGFDLIGGAATDSATGFGGGILCCGELTLNRCKICGCVATLDGGGIEIANGGNATINDSLICGNKATLDGGGVSVATGAAVAFAGSTVAGNVSGVADGFDDVFCDDDFSAATATNSIISTATAADSSTIFISKVNVGNVLNVDVSAIGFVASPGVSAPNSSWTATAWQNWDFHLRDYNSSSPSHYLYKGLYEYKTTYDVEGNFRESNSTTYNNTTNEEIKQCSPGYETIQADLFWIGRDSTGTAVTSPSWTSADGWAASRFATSSGTMIPTINLTYFIGADVDFDAPNLFVGSSRYSDATAIIIGGGRVVSFAAFQTSSGIASVDFSLGVGAKIVGQTSNFYSSNSAKFGDYAFASASLVGGAPSTSTTPSRRLALDYVGEQVVFSAFYTSIFIDDRIRYDFLMTYTSAASVIVFDGLYDVGYLSVATHTSASGSIGVAEGTKINVSTATFGSSSATTYPARLFSVPPTLILSSTAAITDNAFKNLGASTFADAFVVELRSGAAATLNLGGQKVCGVGTSASLTGRATVDGDGLTVDSLTLNANAVLTFDAGTLKTTNLSTAAGSAFVGSGTLSISASGVWTNSGATLGGVSAANYDADANALKIRVYDPIASLPDSNAENSRVYLTSPSFVAGTPFFIVEKYASGTAGAPGAYSTIYDSQSPITDETADVCEASFDWGGVAKKTLVDATSTAGWNFYRISPKGPVEKGGASLGFDDSETRRLAVWLGENRPERSTYYYRGGANGSFANASDWASTADGVAEFDGAPIFAANIVVFPKSANVSDYPNATENAPTRIDVVFPNIVSLFDSDGESVDESAAPLVSVDVPKPCNLSFYVGNGGTSGTWTTVDAATGYEIESVETTPKTFASVGASWSNDAETTAKSWRVRVASPIYGGVKNWSNAANAATPIVGFSEKATETSVGSRSFSVVYAEGFPGDLDATITRRRVGSYVADSTVLNSAFAETGFSDLPPTSDEYVYRIAWNASPNVWLETTSALWNVGGAFGWIAETIFPTSENRASETPTFAARIFRRTTGEALRREEVASIRYSLFESRDFWRIRAERLATGSLNEPWRRDVSVPASSVRDSLLTDANFWTKDAIGGNFVFTPESLETPFFPAPGEYVVKATLETVGGEKIVVDFFTRAN